MKKLIQVFSLLSLVFVFAAVSASAQSEYGSEVEVPFSFTVGDRSYEAGKYIVKLSKMHAGAAILNIGDPQTDTFQTVLAQRNGARYDRNFKLVFKTVDGEKVLSQIITPNGGFALRKSSSRNIAEKRIAAETEVVNISGVF